MKVGGIRMDLKGIHHVSSLTAKAPENFDFYSKKLGLRLVKKTVNQDNPSVYHLFYGDEKGSPGTDITFFEIPHMAQNHNGNNSISSVFLRVLNNQALEFWKERFEKHKIEHDDIIERNGHQTLAFRDFEGQRLILISDEHNKGVEAGIPWNQSPIPSTDSICGLGPVKLTVPSIELTKKMLIEVMGFKEVGHYPSDIEGQPDILVFETGEGGNGAEVHLEERKDLPSERQGRGGVHHVAFRVEDEKELREWIKIIDKAGISNSGLIDRYYFHSLYFKEPNGILFELATDGPGFSIDEDSNLLGENLSLPPFLESEREAIKERLKPLDTKVRE